MKKNTKKIDKKQAIFRFVLEKVEFEINKVYCLNFTNEKTKIIAENIINNNISFSTELEDISWNYLHNMIKRECRNMAIIFNNLLKK